MSGVLLQVQTFVSLISSPNYVVPAYPVLIASMAFILTLQFVNKYDVIYRDSGSNPLNLINLEFDFIVVGTGSGGATIAGRLAEKRNWKVLSIEAGITPNLNSEVPQLFTTMLRTFQDWGYYNYEKRACKAQSGGKCYTPRGKVIGGTSAINAMLFVRGFHKRYNRWRDVYNCTGWAYEDVLPYFKKFEGNTYDWKDPKYHRQCGPVCISHFLNVSYQNFFAQAGSEMDPPVPTVSDINSGFEGPCYVTVQGFVCNGRRFSAAKAYINPIKNQTNYSLIQDSIVTKIIFDSTKKATGVEFYRDGIKYFAKAKKEVIVSGGAFGSPILLMRSGIGPQAELARNNIQQVVDLPQVGRKLADHVSVFMWFELTLIQEITSLTQLGVDILQYNVNPRTGKFAGIGTGSSIAFLSVPGSNDANIECYHYLMTKSSLDLPEVLRWMGYEKNISDAILLANQRSAVALVTPMLLEPYSLGVVGLNGQTGVNAFITPNISYNFFSDPQNRDRTVMIKAMQDQIAREQTPTYQKAGAKLINVIPKCFEFPYASDQFCDCYIDYFGSTFYHPVGTCGMGNNTLTSVVNPKGQVHGTKSLRVADASIFPEIPWGNTHSPSMMVAEKISDDVKIDWGETIENPEYCP